MTEFLHKRSDVTLHQWASTDVVCGNQTRPVKEWKKSTRYVIKIHLLPFNFGASI